MTQTLPRFGSVFPNDILKRLADLENVANGGTIGGTTPPAVGAPFLPLAGGTMTGPLILSGDATLPLGAVTLQQLNAHATLGVFPIDNYASTVAGGAISGSVDCTPAFNAAKAAAMAAGGGRIWATPGQAYGQSSSWELDSPHLSLESATGLSAKLVPLVGGTFTNGQVHVVANDILIRSIGFQPASATTASNPAADAIKIESHLRVFVEDVQFWSVNGWCVNAIPTGGLSSNASPNSLWFNKLYARNPLGGIHVQGGSNLNYSVAAQITDCFIDQAQGGECFWFEDCHDVTVSGCDGSANGPAVAGTIAGIRLTGNCAAIHFNSCDVGCTNQVGSKAMYLEQKTISAVVYMPRNVVFTGGILIQAENGLWIEDADVGFEFTSSGIALMSNAGVVIAGGTTVRLANVNFNSNGLAGVGYEVDVRDTAPQVWLDGCDFNSNLSGAYGVAAALKCVAGNALRVDRFSNNTGTPLWDTGFAPPVAFGVGVGTTSAGIWSGKVNGSTTLDQYGSSFFYPVNLRSARGTFTTPTQLLSGDPVGGAVKWGGYGTTIGWMNDLASIGGLARENFDATHGGTALSVKTTRLGAVTSGETFRFDEGGGFNSGSNVDSLAFPNLSHFTWSLVQPGSHLDWYPSSPGSGLSFLMSTGSLDYQAASSGANTGPNTVAHRVSLISEPDTVGPVSNYVASQAIISHYDKHSLGNNITGFQAQAWAFAVDQPMTIFAANTMAFIETCAADRYRWAPIGNYYVGDQVIYGDTVYEAIANNGPGFGAVAGNNAPNGGVGSPVPNLGSTTGGLWKHVGVQTINAMEADIGDRLPILRGQTVITDRSNGTDQVYGGADNYMFRNNGVNDIRSAIKIISDGANTAAYLDGIVCSTNPKVPNSWTADGSRGTGGVTTGGLGWPIGVIATLKANAWSSATAYTQGAVVTDGGNVYYDLLYDLPDWDANHSGAAVTSYANLEYVTAVVTGSPNRTHLYKNNSGSAIAAGQDPRSGAPWTDLGYNLNKVTSNTDFWLLLGTAAALNNVTFRNNAPSPPKTITNMTWAAGVMTVTTSVAHKFQVGNNVAVRDALPQAYNTLQNNRFYQSSLQPKVASVINATTFTIANAYPTNPGTLNSPVYGHVYLTNSNGDLTLYGNPPGTGYGAWVAWDPVGAGSVWNVGVRRYFQWLGPTDSAVGAQDDVTPNPRFSVDAYGSIIGQDFSLNGYVRGSFAYASTNALAAVSGAGGTITPTSPLVTLVPSGTITSLTLGTVGVQDGTTVQFRNGSIYGITFTNGGTVSLPNGSDLTVNNKESLTMCYRSASGIWNTVSTSADVIGGGGGSVPATSITGILPVAHGGTGAANLNGLLQLGSAVNSLTAGFLDVNALSAGTTWRWNRDSGATLSSGDIIMSQQYRGSLNNASTMGIAAFIRVAADAAWNSTDKAPGRIEFGTTANTTQVTPTPTVVGGFNSAGLFYVGATSGGAAGTIAADGTVTGLSFTPTGIGTATSATRYVGGRATTAPTSGAWLKGDWVICQNGDIAVCTTAGTPGTWVTNGTGGSGAGIPGSTFTAKGQLLAATGSAAYTTVTAPTTSGQLLIADTTAGTDMAWQTLAGDATLGAAGTLTIANLAITNAKIAAGTIDLTAKVTGALPIANAGTNITTYTTGDILYASATNVLSKLAAVASGQVLASAGTTTAPTYTATPTLTSVTLNGGTNQTALAGYREGTFTPALTGSTTAGTGQTYGSTTTGTYTRIGRIVYFRLRMTMTALGTAAGNMQITGLPYASTNTAGYQHVMACEATVLASNVVSTNAKLLVNATQLLIDMRTAASASTSVMQCSDLGASGDVYITGFYETTAAF